MKKEVDHNIKDLTTESSKEEVSQFFNFEKEIKNNILKEDISGEILIELKGEDFHSLGIGIGDKKKIKTYLDKNMHNFKPKPIKRSISIYSNTDEIKSFFDNYLNFKKELNFEEIQVFGLKDENMKQIGLNLGQRIKLKKYIEYVNKHEIIIDKKSSKEKVALFLENVLLFSKEAINGLDLDGESIFLFDEDEIDESEDFQNLTKEEKEKLKNFLKVEKEKESLRDIKIKKNLEKENEIIINKKNNNNLNEDIIKNYKDENINLKKNKLEEGDLKIFKKKINNNKNKNEKEIIFELKDNEIILNKKQEKNAEENYLYKDNKNANKSNINNGEVYDNNYISNLDKINIVGKEKEKTTEINESNNMLLKNKNLNLNQILNENKKKEMESKISNENFKINHIINKKQEYINHKQKNKNNHIEIKDQAVYNNKNPNVTENHNTIQNDKKKKINEGKKIVIEKIKDNKEIKYEVREYEGKISNEINYNSLYNYTIQPVIKDSKFNIFFLIGIIEKYVDYLYLSTYVDNSSLFTRYIKFFSPSLINYKPYYIDEAMFYKNKEKIKYIMIQIPIKKKDKKILVELNINKNYTIVKNEINIEKNVDNYFLIDNLNYDNIMRYKFLKNFEMNELFIFYFRCFFNKKENEDERLQKSLLEALISKVDKLDKLHKLKLNAEFILKFFKYCFYFKLQPKNINCIELITNEQKKVISINEEYKRIIIYEVNESEKPSFLKLILKIYAIYYKEYLVELIESKGSEIYYKYIMDLINEKVFKINDLIFHSQDSLLIYQKAMLKICKTKKEIEELIKLSIGFVNGFLFIKENYEEIILILENSSKIYKRKEKNYLLEMPEINKTDNIEDIYKLLQSTIKLEKTNNDFKIINYEKILKDLLNLYMTFLN